MAYKKSDLVDQSIRAIKENNLIYQDEIFAFVSFSERTFYYHKLQNLQDIKKALSDSRIKLKTELRNEFRKSKNPTERIVLYRLLASEEEFKRIATSHYDHTSGGDKIQPLEITVAQKETTDKIQKLINESQLN